MDQQVELFTMKPEKSWMNLNNNPIFYLIFSTEKNLDRRNYQLFLSFLLLLWLISSSIWGEILINLRKTDSYGGLAGQRLGLKSGERGERGNVSMVSSEQSTVQPDSQSPDGLEVDISSQWQHLNITIPPSWHTVTHSKHLLQSW